MIKNLEQVVAMVLTSLPDQHPRMLRAKSMECITLVGMATGKEKFRADANQVGVSCLFLYFVKQECKFVLCNATLSSFGKIVGLEREDRNLSTPASLLSIFFFLPG